ncbi:MAG: hypothetical protein JW720_12925 [Sedimentisphaerales bacterium]|nr:hypothetical protein [Sedimentisphaerales bacterium]
MNTYNPVFSRNCVLNEQIARQVFELLPDTGPVMVIIDREGHVWPSDSERYSTVNVPEYFLKELCAKIDDGVEPVVTQAGDHSVIAAQLATVRTNCGYVMVIIPGHSPESTLVNIDLVEILLNQVGLIARLIEKNNLLYEQQVNQYRSYPQTVAALN